MLGPCFLSNPVAFCCISKPLITMHSQITPAAPFNIDATWTLKKAPAGASLAARGTGRAGTSLSSQGCIQTVQANRS